MVVARHKATVLMIEIALHYYCFPTEYRNGDFRAPAVRGALELMLEKELLIGSLETGFERGPALLTYVEALKKVPFPVKQWVIP